MPILRLPEFFKRQQGIYIISPQPPTDETIAFKIESTVGLNQRLNSYHVCFDKGFYIYRALVLNDIYSARTTQNKIKASAKLKEIKEYLYGLLTDLKIKACPLKWFADANDLKKIDDALIKTYNRFRRDLDYPVLKFYRPYYNSYHIDGITTVTQSIA